MKVSVIIPVYNVEKYLRRCVDSILGQTYRDVELLLIDDGSMDSSSSICDTYVAQDSRVRAFHKQNGGVSSARNYGMERAQGEWIWFVDSDDYAETDALQRFAEILADHPDMDVYKFGFTMERSEGNLVFSAPKPMVTSSTSQMILSLETYCYSGFLWNTIFRRSTIGKNRFNEEISYCEDHLFSFTVFAETRKMFIDTKRAYHYVAHKDSLSNIYRHPALYIVKAACLTRDAKLRCIEPDADLRVVSELKQKILQSHKSQLYVAYDVLFSHSFRYKESREVFRLINKKLPVVCAWMYYYLRYHIHKYRNLKSLQ